MVTPPVDKPLRRSQVELLDHLLRGLRSPSSETLHRELGSWLSERKRFEALLSANKDKVRKKLRSAADDGALQDVRAELLVAFLLSGERRFDIHLEAYGSGRRGPDFAIAFRERQRFDVEVTRIRARPDAADAGALRLTGVICAKLRQLTAGVPNILAIVDASPRGTAVADAVRAMKLAADRGDMALLARGDFASARDFYARFVRLSAVAVIGHVGAVWLNPEARHVLPREVALAISRALDPLAPDILTRGTPAPRRSVPSC